MAELQNSPRTLVTWKPRISLVLKINAPKAQIASQRHGLEVHPGSRRLGTVNESKT